MKDKILQRLSRGHLATLIHICLDHLLHQPINELLQPRFLADQIALAFHTAADGEQTEVWAREQVDAIRKLTPEGKPKDHLSDELLEPIAALLSDPIQLDVELTERLLDHEAVELLFRDVLTSTLQSFSTKIRSLTTNAPKTVSRGFGALRGLRDRALQSTPLGGIAQQLESQFQQKINEHVERSIRGTLQQVAQHLTLPANREKQAAYRLHILQTVIDTDNQVFLHFIDQLGTEKIVASIASTIRRIIAREGFHDALHQAILQGLEMIGDKTVAQLLEESGMGEDWREETESQLTQLAQNFIQDHTFEEWLSSLLKE